MRSPALNRFGPADLPCPTWVKPPATPMRTWSRLIVLTRHLRARNVNPVQRLDPDCDQEEYVFVALPSADAGIGAVATVQEPEGLSGVLPRTEADRRGLAYDYVAAWIVLGAQTDLDAIGVTAAVASELARLGISCNIVAGLRHDHVFVPHGRAREAAAAIARLTIPAPPYGAETP